MKHLVMFSGGLSSACVLWYIHQKYPAKTIALFTDTLIEDDDLYRFNLEIIQRLYKPELKEIIFNNLNIPDYSVIEKRKKYLEYLRLKHTKFISEFKWLSLQQTPFDIFQKEKLMGNSLFDPCSKILKRSLALKYIKLNYRPNNVRIYIGFDHDEPNRINKSKNYWQPYRVDFPLAVFPYIYEEFTQWLVQNNIEIPQLYKKGFSHNNCGGFCVKAGQKQFFELHENYPERYEQFSQMELQTYQKIGTIHPFIKKQKKNVIEYLTMKQFKEKYMQQNDTIDNSDDHSCSCFL